MTVGTEHAWLQRASCGPGCVHAGADSPGHQWPIAVRTARRVCAALALFSAVWLLALPMPGRSHLQRGYCRLMLRSLGVRMSVSGGPIRNVPGVLVVSGHVSWLDIFTIGTVLPGSFVARGDLVDWPALGPIVRIMKVIPIDRARLRRLPAVVAAVADRLRAGHTVIAFPEGTTWCGLGYGRFRPAMFQAAIDAGRPVQPLRLSYRHGDGRPSTVPAFVGDDSLLTSIRRVITARRTVCHIHVESLQLPGDDRRDLTARCEAAVRGASVPVVASARGEGHALVA
ncbi:1-acyl-sn-glycerol-3-phosphate acyltransferase [Mycolicibacterium chubuense NBB4]|uniref:1-acyl-sn-glycerol-3-phosphate acyltransferase n=1 Tax=Mycolicibacterium chubuense (strain NBB4) TaxID=710421 RepID=I4BH55_MYCCN|nr:lysophospholipid acyltransferase family protein [Mycolicibacterium chubuense]AFM16612.1 1-acyl-sn-glycerol-3-phosphate acyltransferase [Mycolicibacterium chubuense NBB4]